MESENKNQENLLNPFHIFPLEVWESIFHNVDDSLDCISLYKTSSSFRHIRKKRTTFLFPEILRFLARGYISETDLLNLRCLCKAWKERVDNYLEMKIEQLDVIQQLGYSKGTILWYLETPIVVQEFLDIFDADSNPFIGKVVFLELSGDPNDPNDIRTQTNKLFLERFGRKISFLSLDTNFIRYDNTDREIKFISVVQECLNLVPNLKLLNLSSSSSDSNSHPVPEDPKITEFLSENPFPRLKCLEKLYLEWDFGWNDILLKMCCDPKKLKQLSMLHMPTWLPPTFPRLEVVHTNLNESSLTPLGKSGWPLRALKLDVVFNPITFNHLFPTVINFRETLTTLIVDYIGSNFVLGKLDLPNLKSLEIKALHSPLDFLAELESLERLEIEFASEDIQDGKIIQFCGSVEGEGDDFTCNIWEVVPTLKYFSVEDFWFKRGINYACHKTDVCQPNPIK